MVDVINNAIELLARLGEAVVSIMIPSPFTLLENALPPELLGYINFYVPVEEMLNLGTGWILAIGVWYFVSIVLRWAKAVE